MSHISGFDETTADRPFCNWRQAGSSRRLETFLIGLALAAATLTVGWTSIARR